MKKTTVALFALFSILAGCKQEPKATEETSTPPTDPLPSWNEGASKKAIIDFVTKTTTEGSAYFIPVTDRIACFDNDGTLWSEQPLYFQFISALDRLKEIAPQ